MSDTVTNISWIFLAIGIASEKEPADYKSISQIADGINHAVPTDKEMQTSIKWLLQNDLILKNNKKYSLTDSGANLIKDSKENTKTLMKIWDNLKTKIQTDYD
jgi:predicted transcriptional regulator